MRWILENIQKYSFFAKLKKCQFFQDKVKFLEFVRSFQGIKIEEKRIKVAKTLSKPQLLTDI